MNPQNHAPQGGFSLSRRRVVTTAAWSVPAVTVATAAPAFALSPTAIGVLSIEDPGVGVAFSGTRYTALPRQRQFTIQNLAVRNAGPDALPNGALMLTITVPAAWGDITRRRTEDGAWPAGYVESFEGNVLTIIAGPTVGAIPAGEVLNIADLGGLGTSDDLWFETSLNGTGNLSDITVTVGTYDTHVQTNFTGGSRSATVGFSVWSTS